MLTTRPVYIAGSLRTPFFKSWTVYKDLQARELLHQTVQGLVTKLKLDGRLLGDVALGSLVNLSNNWDLARECVLSTTLDPHTPAYNIQRACATSLDATLQIALRISNYQIEQGIAGGVDTNSDTPLLLSYQTSQKLLALRNAKSFADKMKIIASFRIKDFLPQMPALAERRTGLSMGEHCELMVKEWQISREAQDAFALRSQKNGIRAYDENFYDDLVLEVLGKKRDGILRADTSLEKLAALKPAFDFSGRGTLTAGNSSPLTDGAAAVFLVSEEAANQYGYPKLARFVDAQTAAIDYVHGEGLLMAPTIAVNELLKRNHLTLQDFDIYEIHEAFAGQVLCTLKAWESAEYCKDVLNRDQPLGSIDSNKINLKGGSVALGHPFAATGARIVGAVAKMLHQRGNGRALISICAAGGLGTAAILEAVQH